MATPSTIATLPRITASALSSIILAQSSSSSSNRSIAIIDVRDDDYIGGHIIGSTHVPSRTLDYKIPELVRKLQNKDTVVFHCALSQQRGPSAALQYIQARERILGSSAVANTDDPDSKKGESEISNGKDVLSNEEKKRKNLKEQKIYVLNNGFVGWVEQFGEDERLTEGYQREIWKDGYWMD